MMKYQERTDKLSSLQKDCERFLNQSSMNDMLREDRKELQKMVNFKRERSPKEVTDEPVLL